MKNSKELSLKIGLRARQANGCSRIAYEQENLTERKKIIEE